jgi:hypothetical protein
MLLTCICGGNGAPLAPGSYWICHLPGCPVLRQAEAEYGGRRWLTSPGWGDMSRAESHTIAAAVQTILAGMLANIREVSDGTR